MTGASTGAAVRRAVPGALAVVIAGALAVPGCGAKASNTKSPPPATARPAKPPRAAPRPPQAPLGPEETYLYRGEAPATEPAPKEPVEEAETAGLLDVDLSDGWLPFIFAPEDVPYRKTFVDLANDRVNPDGLKTRKNDNGTPAEHNYLEPFGIPPTLSVLLARVEEELAPERVACHGKVDLPGIRTFTGNVIYLDRERARREHGEAIGDDAWLKHQLDTYDTSMEKIAADPKTRMRVERWKRGQERMRAVRAVQAKLVCDGLLSPRSHHADGVFDLPTHEALAAWERRNDIFGWGFIGGETQEALLRAPMDLHFDTFKRILAERLADAARIIEDGSTAKWKRPATYQDEDGVTHPVPDLVGDFVGALLAAIKVGDADEMTAFLRAHGPAGLGKLHVSFKPPALPPYYSDDMDFSVDIDRGDVWYDFPYDEEGKAAVQPRDRFPHLKLSVTWNGQRIPLVWWRTTIGSWRSELHADGRIYMKYKNSDVGPRVWRHIVAGPVWVPPDGTPAKDLLTRKVLDRDVGPVPVVNTDVMGPGFGSAYGLVAAIHVRKSGSGWFDNQIRTHGSVDYTSIARRFSHGCHRLVNNRAVRMFDLILRRHPFEKLGNQPLKIRKKFTVDEKDYSYELKTRGYYYELPRPIPVMVGQGRVLGKQKKPITAYMPKPGVDYSDVATGDAPAAETAPVLGP